MCVGGENCVTESMYILHAALQTLLQWDAKPQSGCYACVVCANNALNVQGQGSMFPPLIWAVVRALILWELWPRSLFTIPPSSHDANIVESWFLDADHGQSGN